MAFTPQLIIGVLKGKFNIRVLNKILAYKHMLLWVVRHLNVWGARARFSLQYPRE